MLPDIVRQVRRLVRGLTPQVREEALDEAVAGALVAFARLAQLGKQEIAFAGPLARYAIARYHSGRRVGVRTNVRDVLSPLCRRRNQLTIEELDRFDRSSGSWQEVLVADRRFTPADAAVLRIDFRAWLASLTKRNRQVAERLATGESTSSVARQFGISRGRISQLRRELYDAWRMFQGEGNPV
jgi:hypothetical protein